MTRSLLLASALLSCAALAHAELYKWVGPDGKISYSDTPPPASASRVETRALPAAAAAPVALPYQLAQAAKASPVTLYTTANCAPCEDGRKLLATRGIPYSEKTVNTGKDTLAFRKLAGSDARLPLLLIGSDQERGFERDAWNTALSAAGYPETSALPHGYRNPPPQAAAPAAPSVKKAAAEAEASARQPADAGGSGELPPALGNAPPGFRF